jgi:hypothetical protein
MRLVIALLLAAQSNEQAVETYRKALDHQARGAHAEALRLCEDLVKARADKEGLLRVRVGAGLEDREFEPRRLAGDACLQLARNTADLEERLKRQDEALAWYQKAADLKLAKAGPLLAAAKAEREKTAKEIEGARGAELVRRRLEEVKTGVTKKVVDREFEAAFAEVEGARPRFPGQDAALDAMRADVAAAFGRWHDGLKADLRSDLEGARPAAVLAEPARFAERLARYRIPAAQAAPARLDPALAWAGRLGAWLAGGADPAAGEAVAADGLVHGAPAWRLAAGLVLERRAVAVKDPGAAAALDARWAAVNDAEGAFAAAASKLRSLAEKSAAESEGARKQDLAKWTAEELPAFERRVAEVRRGLPDRDAPKAVEGALARLKTTAGAKPDAYAAVEAELDELRRRSVLDGPTRARLLAGLVVARAHALFLGGLPREEVLERCRPAVRDAVAADPGAFASWQDAVSPRVLWLVESASK